ncbi:uncharacterized protein DUF2570 [Frischella perrara]|uniref:DUF2570 domain-containing protein n=1 Tax=Frischella perrara TaxID=1267021 RepID=A0A0A7S0Z7_FRIPE|nr:DUF2570 domain-containing protein [Frischella perrara]AJA44507.1 hypothetical protein FPB0191_00677 [Frischella perrara]PWV65171.1 uncharacterized protein DUF2570 [Frischella perrara]
MLNLKTLHKLYPFIVIIFFSTYFIYQLYQSNQAYKKENAKLLNEIHQLQQKIINDNKIIVQNEAKKQELENQSLELQEKLDELLKDIPCANQYVPNDIANRLYSRAKSIRQSTAP